MAVRAASGVKLYKVRSIDPVFKKHHGEFSYHSHDAALDLEYKGVGQIVGELQDKQPDGKKEESNPDVEKRISVTEYLRRDRFRKQRDYVKVLWIQDFSRMGGAELSNTRVIDCGRRCGFDTVGVTPKTFTNYSNLSEQADVLIINNLFEFSPEQFRTIQHDLYENKRRYVKYDHDFRELRRQNISRPLFSRSALNVFLSPKHQQDYTRSLGSQIEGHSVTLPLAIDPDQYFRDETIPREHGSVLVPTLRKCTDAANKYVAANNDKKYYVVGKGGSLKARRVEHLHRLNTRKMVEMYNRCGYMLHIPDSRWPGERVYFEAILCGCEPIVNENVGHASWSWGSDPDRIREELSQAPFAFWRAVERSMV